MENKTDNNRYKTGKIYRLVNSVDEEIYIGSTCTSLAKRFYTHKNDAKRKPRPVHKHLNDIGWDNVDIVLVEEYPCENKNQLERRERYWIEELKPSLNKYIPTRTINEYIEENADKVREMHAKYRAENADKIRERQAKYRVENPEKVRESHAKYRAENAEKLRERSVKYRVENPEKLRERQAKYRAENADKERARHAKYHAENKDAINARRREARALKKQASSS